MVVIVDVHVHDCMLATCCYDDVFVCVIVYLLLIIQYIQYILYYTIIIVMSSFLHSLLQLWNCALEVLRDRFVECKCM